MSGPLSAELAATCNALGYFDPASNKYYADSNTLETVKDLIRYLRRDDDSHDIRRHLGETQVLQTDLLPLLKSYWEETDLFDVLLRLLVNLTSPALMLWHEVLPTEKSARNLFLQIEDHLQKYKQAFADEAVWAVLSTRLSKILETDFAERGEENSLIIERILILIRNVLYVPANPDAEKRPDNDASVHDQVLWALHQSGMLDIILFITSSATEQAYYMHALEILSFLLREQSASDLAHAELQRSQTEKMRDEAELLAIRHRETNQKQQKIKMYNGARHSRFGGTFVVKSMKSISDNELIYHKPLNRLDALNFDVDKKKPKTPKNRLPPPSATSERRSAFSIRLFLKEFCIEFLNGAYNTLMYHVRDNLVRAKAQDHDESYYLWALRFFMEFNRCYKFEVKLVSETMSVQSFHYVQQQMEKYFDMITIEKKKFAPWSRRLHLSLLAYRELLLTLCAMDKCPDGTVRDSARVIKSNIFYVLEYRELIVTLMVTFDELKLSNSYLNDLIETQHIFMRMFQSYCEKYGSVVVQKKTKAKKRKKKAAAASAVAAPEPNMEELWDEAAPQLSTVLEGASHIPTDVVPFDAASEVPIDEQKSEAMKNIQRHLRGSEFENALGLLRAAREVWPENDCFGSPTIAPEEELLALRDIFFADLGEELQPQERILAVIRRLSDSAKINGVAILIQREHRHPNWRNSCILLVLSSSQENAVPSNLQPLPEDHAQDDEEEDDEELEGIHDMPETNIDFPDFAKRFAHPKIVRACGLALRNFEHNSVQTNHCIVKLLHRIAWDSQMFAMIFQASIFRTFQKIYVAKGMPQFKELVKFATYILRQFFKVVETNPKAFMEVLFWKSSRDAHDVEHGYGSHQESSQAAAKAWTELQEDELRRLFMEHQEKQITEDVVDWIVNNLIDNTRSRRAVLKKLKEMCLLTEYKRGGSGTASSRRQWGEDEEAQLRELYEQFKDAMDPLGCIMDRLDVRRPKNRIAEKLLVMGLIQDKKEVRKKRAKKSRGPQARDQSPSHHSESSELDDSDDSDDDTASTSQRPHAQTKKQRASQNTTKKSSKNRKKSKTQTLASPEELVKLLRNVLEMTEALEWLKESLSDVADDLEENPDDSDEGVPLVAIMDSAVTAMENADFKKLLQAFGVKEPADEQESYWRIPSTLTLATLRQHCQLLTDALENNLPEAVMPTETSQNEAPSVRNDEDLSSRGAESDCSNSLPSVDLVPNNTKITSHKSKKKRPLLDSDDESSSDASQGLSQKVAEVENVDKPSQNASHVDRNHEGDSSSPKQLLQNEIDADEVSATQRNSTKTRRRIAVLDSDDEDDQEENSRTLEEAFEVTETNKPNGRKYVLESDDEEYASEKENMDSASDKNKRQRDLSDSENQVPRVKRSRLLISDDEDES